MKNNQITKLIKLEEERQRTTLMMIPSENYASKAVRKAMGSILMNKYSEGYPGKRYYQGNKIIDEIENFAIAKAKKLFAVPYVNVQPYSGSPANAAIYFALVPPGGKIMGLKLASGGHLTHGHPNITFSGRFYQSVQFGINKEGIIDYNEVEKLAKKRKPELLMIGTTAYPLILDWSRFAKIADSIGAWLVADISHIAGLILAGVYPSPAPHAHVIMTTTHKTLRGPRGAMIMVTQKGIEKDPEIPSKIDRAVFPGLQGGPHDNTTAAIAQALVEADTESFKKYGRQIVVNAKCLASEFKSAGLSLVAGGTESHLIVIDLSPLGLSGKDIADVLEKAGVVTNKNTVPADTSAFNPSGIRLGTPAVTTRGMKETEMKLVASWIVAVIKNPKDKILVKTVAQKVKNLCKKFPVR